MPKPDPRSIIVLLTETGAVTMYVQFVSREGYNRGEHFTGFISTEGVEEIIIPHGPQLMFINLLSFNLQMTVDYVRRMKVKNHELIVVLYSPPGCKDDVFDFYINTDVFTDIGEEFRRLTQEFIEGKLRAPKPEPMGAGE